MKFYALAASVVLALGAPAVTVGAATPAAGDTDEVLTVQDCDVWVALGRAKLDWGSATADKSQFDIFYRPSASGGFVQQCPWSKYSIAPPAIDSYDEQGPSTRLSRPVYEARQAHVDISHVMRWGPGWGINSQLCTLSHERGRWIVRQCDPGPMT